MNFVARAESETGPRLMKHGDLTIIYERHDSLNHIYLSTGEILNNKFGAFYHDDIIGKPFGSKIISRNTTGWMYALEPSPELWSLAVHTRTQIVNELDASIITLNLDVFPGCIVVESGNLLRPAPDGYVDNALRGSDTSYCWLTISFVCSVTQFFYSC